jgi:integrase
MKAGREHRVPLSERATAILAKMSAARTGDHVFPGADDGHLSPSSLQAVLKRKGIEGATVHGFIPTYS